MRIVVISHPSVIADNRRVFNMLSQHGFEVSFVVPSKWVDDYGNLVNTQLGDKIYPADILGIGKIVTHLYRISALKHVWKMQPEIIYVHNEPYAISTIQFAVLNIFMRKKLGFYSAQNINKPHILIKLLRSISYSASSFAFPITCEVEQVLRATGFSGKTSIIPLPISSEPNGLRQYWKKGERLHIGFVGRLVPEKGIMTLLEAISTIAPGSVELTIIGDGPQRKAVYNFIAEKRMSNINVLGFIDKDSIDRYYDSFDCLVVPSIETASWKEQFGRVIVEAASRGCFVIGSTCGEIPNLIANLKCGTIFAQGDANALREVISSILSGQHNTRGYAEDGMNLAHESYNLQKVAKKMASALKEE